MDRPAQRLLVFTRYPVPGKAKTRLIPALGATAAAALQRQMTEYTIAQFPSLVQQGVSIEIWFAGSGEPANEPASERAKMQAWLGDNWTYQPQPDGDLGDRLRAAFAAAFAAGMTQVIVIGTDCPGVTADRLTQAFRLLEDHDVVLGPATDGGYYGLGMSRFIPELLNQIAWGTDAVFQQTIAIAQSLHLSIATTAPLTDIDRPEDLPVWAAAQAAPQAPPPLSVIIPTLNEAKTIAQTLAPLPAQPIEIIVADGGSQDETRAIAQQQGAIVLQAGPGRARQMNRGAAIATGEILLFLHADTRLPENFLPIVQSTLAQPQVIAGAFALTIQGDRAGLRWVERGVAWRSRLLQMPYGDQAIFLKAAVFHQLGGFPDLPIMEDFALVQQLRSRGKVAIAPAAVLTSGRRWQKLGVWQTTLINQLVILAYFLGVSPDRLAQWYRGRLK